jgi:hypothetical protein
MIIGTANFSKAIMIIGDAAGLRGVRRDLAKAIEQGGRVRVEDGTAGEGGPRPGQRQDRARRRLVLVAHAARTVSSLTRWTWPASRIPPFQMALFDLTLATIEGGHQEWRKTGRCPCPRDVQFADRGA